MNPFRKSEDEMVPIPMGDGFFREVKKGSTEHVLSELEQLRCAMHESVSLSSVRDCDSCGCLTRKWVTGKPEIRTRQISPMERKNRDGIRPVRSENIPCVYYEEDYLYYPVYCKRCAPPEK